MSTSITKFVGHTVYEVKHTLTEQFKELNTFQKLVIAMYAFTVLFFVVMATYFGITETW